MQIDLSNINKRKENLEFTKRELKNHFIGIDKIIDELMDYIQVWYLMPELLTRPVVINLWGMTGVGKTDLIRRMVKCLDYSDRFQEIELSNIDTTSYINSVSTILSNNDLNDDKPAIILFDEIQRFNTLDADGNPLPQTKFIDFWELLSDGKLSKKQKENIDYYISYFMSQERDLEKRKLKGEENLDENPQAGQWEYAEIRKMLGNDLDAENKKGTTQKELLEKMLKAKSKKTIYEPIDHSKKLLIISGNLDEAFNVATQTSESDVDADIFHNNTSKINLVDIKNALSRKFRPEQVARFGNIHLIYTSLKRQDYENLIKKEIERITKNIQTNFSVKVEISNSINELIYQNGVFPVQGVRPVFSSIVDILESNLSKFLFEAILEKKKAIQISYNKEQAKIECSIESKKIEVPFIGKMDKIRQSNFEDTVANISVHESGHAVAYMLLFGIAPLQLKSKIASSYAGGFTFPHTIHRSKENIIKEIKVLLAGGIAEEIVFGIENASVGRQNDRERATMHAIDYVRRFGFDDEFHANYMMDMNYALDKTNTDVDVEKMMSRLVAETNQLLSRQTDLLIELSKELAQKGSLDSNEVAVIGRKFSLEVETKNEDYLSIFGYNKLIN